MKDQVGVETGATGKVFPAFGTGEGLLPRVYSQMFHQGWIIAETSSAGRTLHRLLPRVDFLVRFEVELADEEFSAFGA